MISEQKRIEAVNRFMLPDNSIVKDLENIVSLAAQICNAPIALVTLIDKDVQWFKAAIGTDRACINLATSFCKHTMNHAGVLVVPDTASDTRFGNNPMVSGHPYVKFYAGCKLTTKDGFAVGTLCVMDLTTRTLDEHQQKSLKVLSKQVMNLMELSWSLQSLEKEHQKTRLQELLIEESEIKLKAISDSSKDTHILVDRNLEIVAFNRAASAFVRTIFKKKLAHGDSIMEYTDPRLFKLFNKNLGRALKGKPVKQVCLLMPGTRYECWKETSFIPVRDNSAKVIGIAVNSTDITARKQQEEQISTQNEALTRIALMQSHELRRPVASLLGLMNLMKLEHIDFGYLKMMEVTVNELDQKIRGIVKDSENTISGNHLAIVA